MGQTRHRQIYFTGLRDLEATSTSLFVQSSSLHTILYYSHVGTDLQVGFSKFS